MKHYGSIVKKNVDEFFSKKIWIMIFVFSIFALNFIQKARFENFTYWEFIIDVITDHYYILYFMVIFYLFSIFKMIDDDKEIIVIRTGRYINYFVSQVISLFLISIIFVLIHILIVGIVGYGLNMDNRFTMNIRYYNYAQVLGNYSTYFKTPISAIITHIVYMILGLTFMSVVLLTASHYFNKRFVIIGIMSMYVLMIVSMMPDMDKFPPFLFMNNYVILHHALASLEEKFYVMILIEMFFTCCILCIVKKFWHKNFTFGKNLIFKIGVFKWYFKILFSRKNIFIIVTLIIISIINILLRHGTLTIHDLIMLQFYGHGLGYFNLIDFLSLTIYNGIPIYMLAYFLEKESNDRSSFVTIRLKSKEQWFKSVMICGLIFIFIYILTSLCISLIIGSFSGIISNGGGYKYANDLFLENGLKIINPFYMYLIIITSKSLELFFYFLVVVICYIYTKSSTIGFLLVQASYISYFLSGHIVKYTPIGIGSLARMSEFVGDKGISYLFIMVILITVNVVLYLYLKSGIYKRIFN